MEYSSGLGTPALGSPGSDDIDKLKKKFKVIPTDKRYQSQKMGMLNVKFGMMSKREEPVFIKSPYPGDKLFQPAQAHEKLFDLPPINIEVLSSK